MNFLQRNLFIQLRSENFDSKEEMEPMTAFKKDKIGQMMKNLDAIPPGEVRMSNGFLNRRLSKIATEERHAIDTSMETVRLLHMIVANVNAIINNGINLKGIIELGKYLRTRGDKVDFVKLERWLRKLRLQRMAQLVGSVLITFFDFEKDEIPFVRFVERGAYRHTLYSLTHNVQELQDLQFTSSPLGFLRVSNGSISKSLYRSFRYFEYAPVETFSCLFNKIFSSLSNIDE